MFPMVESLSMGHGHLPTECLLSQHVANWPYAQIATVLFGSIRVLVLGRRTAHLLEVN